MLKLIRIFVLGVFNKLEEASDLRKFDSMVLNIKSAVAAFLICFLLAFLLIHSPLNSEPYTPESEERNSIIDKLLNFFEE